MSKKSSPETGVPITGNNNTTTSIHNSGNKVYDIQTYTASIREMYADMHYHPDFPTPPLDPVYPFLGPLCRGMHILI